MALNTVDREKITDTMLKIQSARATLEGVDDEKIPNADEIDACLETADHNLKVALGYAKPKPSEKKDSREANPEEQARP